jgi:transposase-like protein
MDETYVKINGTWYYLYRALDKLGKTVDFLLLNRRNTQAAKTFFSKSFKSSGVPFVINVDKSGSNNAALDCFNKKLGKKNYIEIRQCKYLNNMIEQDHRFIKKRLKPMLWLKSFEGATAVITGIELVQMLRKGQMKGDNDNKSTYDQFISLAA